MKQVKNMENTKQFETMEKKDGGGSGINPLTSLAEVTIPTQAAVEMRVVTTTLGKVKVTEIPFLGLSIPVQFFYLFGHCRSSSLLWFVQQIFLQSSSSLAVTISGL